MTRHARLGPSSSDIWLACLGAPAEWAKRPRKQVGFAAHEGTLAHALCEGALTINAIPWKAGMSFDVDGSQVPVTDEMLDAVKLFTSMANSLSEACLWRVIETEVALTWLWATRPAEEVFGTVDFGACDGFTLYVCDLKYGAGKAVNVVENTQLLCYAVGLLGKLLAERPELARDARNGRSDDRTASRRGRRDPCLDNQRGRASLLGVRRLQARSRSDPVEPPSSVDARFTLFFLAASMDCEAYRSYRSLRHADSFPDDLTLDELEPV